MSDYKSSQLIKLYKKMNFCTMSALLNHNRNTQRAVIVDIAVKLNATD